MLGTLVNTGTVLVGSTVGVLLKRRFPPRVQEVAMQAVGAVTLLIGLQMGLAADSGRKIIVVLLSLAGGAILGEVLDIQGALDRIGQRLERRFAREGDDQFARAFVTASLLFCVGPMTILGSIQDGLQGDATLLFTKAVLDGISSTALAASLGFGTCFAAATVLLYQGALTLAAAGVRDLMTPPVVQAVTAAGGLMIACLAVNIWRLATLRVANMLPGLVLAGVLTGALERAAPFF
jgi:uncharacterized membrane protein YqgA involved in biofilm formation